MCVCVFRHPVRVVCSNHEVVVLQPLKVITYYLGSVVIVNNFILAPPAPPISTVSGSFYIPSSSYHHPHHRALVVLTPLCSTHSPLPLLERGSAHLNVSQTCHLLAFVARLCAPRRVPVLNYVVSVFCSR